MVWNSAPFFWRPIHRRCFDMIKRICYKTPILRLIDYQSDKPVWLICDVSKTGVGAMYGQGPTWNICRPAGFTSKKFTYTQQHYAVHELETLAILEAFQKWEDKLIGRRLHVITDHKALEFFKTQAYLSSRQRRWMDYMSKFDFDITISKENTIRWQTAVTVLLLFLSHPMSSNCLQYVLWYDFCRGHLFFFVAMLMDFYDIPHCST